MLQSIWNSHLVETRVLGTRRKVETRGKEGQVIKAAKSSAGGSLLLICEAAKGVGESINLSGRGSLSSIRRELQTPQINPWVFHQHQFLLHFSSGSFRSPILKETFIKWEEGRNSRKWWQEIKHSHSHTNTHAHATQKIQMHLSIPAPGSCRKIKGDDRLVKQKDRNGRGNGQEDERRHKTKWKVLEKQESECDQSLGEEQAMELIGQKK